MRFCPECKESLVLREIDGAERLKCASQTCGFVFWDNPTPVAAGLVLHEGNFLLARNAQWPAGMYSLITGFVEKGELPEQTITREAKEELNLDVDRMQFIGHFYLAKFNQLLIAYVIYASGQLSTNHEISETLSLTKSELAQFDFGALGLTSEIVGRALQLA